MSFMLFYIPYILFSPVVYSAFVPDDCNTDMHPSQPKTITEVLRQRGWPKFLENFASNILFNFIVFSGAILSSLVDGSFSRTDFKQMQQKGSLFIAEMSLQEKMKKP